MPEVLIPPTIGRVVWFHPSSQVQSTGFAPPAEGQPLAAVVAHVWNDRMVNLAVFDGNGTAHARTSVPMNHEGDPVPAGGYYCEWMPFQKGQARAQAVAGPSAPASAADSAIEAEIQAKGKTAPRVTPADIEANIAGEYSFTVDKAMGEGVPLLPSLSLLTICVIVLKNGFTVTGESACASPENFDADIGRKIARENAVQKIWSLMGYALKQQLHAVATACAPEPD